MMGLQSVSEKMLPFVTPGARTAELINAYVDVAVRKSGAGRRLVAALEAHALNEGYDEIILNSGPRFEGSGWPFWTKMFGEAVDIAKDYYDPGVHAPVWRKVLRDSK